MLDVMHQTDETLVQKWEPVLEGIDNEYTRRVTAQLLENQAKSIVEEKMNEAITAGATTTGQLGTFQKFAFPLVRRVYPNLIANNLVGVQPMQGPVSQVFYLGNDRVKNGSTVETVYSKFNLTYKGLTASAIGSQGNHDQQTVAGTNTFGINGARGTTGGLDGDNADDGFDVSNVLDTVSGLNDTALGGESQVAGVGAPSGTMGGQIAAFPNASAIYGYQLSAGERLTGTGIPEMTFHIEQEAVVANTRKMRALWTLEASQDLKAYHNLDLEKELTTLLSKELALEVDRELIEDLRMIAYGYHKTLNGGAAIGQMDNDYINMGGVSTAGSSFAGIQDSDSAGFFVPKQFTYDFDGAEGAGTNTELGAFAQKSNIYTIDFGRSTGATLYPRHVGEMYANLLAVINLASQDIYKTTMRGPGNWILTSPLVASLLESASKLEGGILPNDGPTNISKSAIAFKGKFMGRYDLYVDPMFPTDEILMGYKGDNAMDAGYVYAPYIPLQQLPTIVDPESFQPRKGILTRYGKVTIEPYNNFYRVIRIIGPTSNFLYEPFAKNTAFNGTTVPSYV